MIPLKTTLIMNFDRKVNPTHYQPSASFSNTAKNITY